MFTESIINTRYKDNPHGLQEYKKTIHRTHFNKELPFGWMWQPIVIICAAFSRIFITFALV